MQSSRRAAAIGLLLASLWGVAACGGESPTASDKTLTYRPNVRLQAEVSRSPREGSLRIERIEYSSVDGQRVPALFAVPTEDPPLGCLIYQGGYGTTKEEMPDLREGLAALRLATFTIDPRNVGARGSREQAAAQSSDPDGLRAMVLGTVADLRVALDYLEGRPECRDNVGYMGTSFGGAVGTLLAAQDARIKAAVLTSIGATFEQLLLVAPMASKSVPDLLKFVPSVAGDPAGLARALRILRPYDLERWIGKIAPRPLLLINGRFDPLVVPADALEIAAAAGSPKTVVFFHGGHDPFAEGPDRNKVIARTARFLIRTLGLPNPF